MRFLLLTIMMLSLPFLAQAQKKAKQKSIVYAGKYKEGPHTNVSLEVRIYPKTQKIVIHKKTTDYGDTESFTRSSWYRSYEKDGLDGSLQGEKTGAALPMKFFNILN